MTAAKAAYLWRWLNEHKNRDKIGYSGYNGQTTFYFDEAVAVEQIHHVADVVPHLGVHVAGTIGKGQRKVGFAGLLLPDFLALDKKQSDDELVRFKLGNVG